MSVSILEMEMGWEDADVVINRVLKGKKFELPV